MDRRRIKSRSGLHRDLQPVTESQASSRDGEAPLSGVSRASSLVGSQKVSNSEMLLRKVKLGESDSETTRIRARRNATTEKADDDRELDRSGRAAPSTSNAARANGERARSPEAERKDAPVSKRARTEKSLGAGKSSDGESDGEKNVLESRGPVRRGVVARIADESNARRSERPTRLEKNVDVGSRPGSGNSDKLEYFLARSGVTLSKDDGPHRADDDPAMIVRKMVHLLSSGDFEREETTELWKAHVNEEDNLAKALNDVSVASHGRRAGAETKFSLVRIVLQIPPMQTAVADHLLRKLLEAVLLANSAEDVPWASLLLQQFRFLETVVDADSLTASLEQLLEACPIWFQRELILFLPDIVIDVQHHAIAETLSRLMETQPELTGVVLECITNLTLGKEYLEDLRDKILNALRKNLAIGRVPSMARFALHACPTVAICDKSLTVLGSLELAPLAGESSEEYSTSQSLLSNELRMSLLLSKEMRTAARCVVKRTAEPPKPLNFIILLLLHSDKSTRKASEGVLKEHVKTGFYRTSFLSTFYQDYKQVARDLQPEALQLASNLLKSEDRSCVEFSIEWFRSQFVSQAETMYKQREIIERMILLMGNNDRTAKGALEILERMTGSADEIGYLQAHCNHLRILLEKMDHFDLQEVASLSDILYALCTRNDSTSESLQDDLFILMQKQLASAKTLTKRKGALNAAMAIKHLAGKPESCRIAKDLIAKVRAGVKNCPRSRALFYDEIGSVIADANNIEPPFLQMMTDKFRDEFVDDYVSDLNDRRSDLVAKFGLNETASEPARACAINFGDGKYGAVVPALFRLLRICYMRLRDGSLEDINVLLGCPVLMPKDTDAPEPRSLDLVICCINWFRELVNAFVSQTDPILEERVLKRLDNAMTLQAEFSVMLKSVEARYQPPPCYFHVFPTPAFVNVEKKVSKKGKERPSIDKTFGIPEWEAWEIGSNLCSKNSAYFRHLDPKVVHLLDLGMNRENAESPTRIGKAQVCFLVKELVATLENGEAPQILVRDLVHLLPKLCAKLKDIVEGLRERDDTKDRRAARLILSLLTLIFDWKGFRTAKYNALLREGLRTLAAQTDRENLTLRSSKELVAESYKYFESIVDVATDVSLAFAVVKICRSLMKHSDTFTQQFKNKQANIASGFLALEWPNDKATGADYKTAVLGFLTNWMQNEPNPLEAVSSVLKWLPDEIPKLDKTRDRLERLPSVTKAIFHHMFRKLFEGMISGVKIALNEAKTDPERINVWQEVGVNLQKIVQICKSSSRSVLLPFLKSMTSLLRIFLASGIPVLEQNLRYRTEQVTRIMKLMQGGTRYLNMVCVDCTEKKDIALAKVVPPAKKLHEKLLFHVKGMLVYNNSSDAFWMGNLVNKNLEGQQIFSQSSSEEPTTTTSPDNSLAADSDDETRSEILQSDVEELSDEDA